MNAQLLRNRLIAEELASGHAFGKHVLEQGEFPGVRTRAQFASEIEEFLNSPDTVMKNGANGKTYYWNDAKGTFLVRNPHSPEGGTYFRPEAGRAYFEKQN